MASPSRHPALMALLLLLLLAAAAVTLHHRRQTPQTIQSREAGGHPTSPAPSPSQAPKRDDSTPSIQDFHRQLDGLTDPAEATRLIAALRASLTSLPPAEAARLIAQFLASSDNTVLPLEFQLGSGGNLASHPTLRVALLDFLGQLAPETAATLSRDLLTTPTHADEWAIALRNVARHDASDRDFLRQKTEALINHPSWQSDPSVGYFESFDILVHTSATESTPLLSSLIRKPDRNDLRHAAFLTLDRLTQRDPATMLTILADDGALNTAYPEMVAQQFARADLNDPEQAAIVSSWLNHPDRSDQQKQAFQAIYPNRNRMISRNLLSDH